MVAGGLGIALAPMPAHAMARVLRTVARRCTAPGPHRAQLGAVRRG